MNIQVQICGLLIISLLMFFFFVNKKIGLFTERVFARILVGSFLCLCFDILSVVLIAKGEQIPEMWTNTVCKAYLISLLWMGFGSFDYLLTDLYTESQYYRRIHYFISVTILESICIFCAPVSWYTEERVVYSFGTATTLTYIFTGIYILTIIIIMLVRAKKLNKTRRIAMTLWMGMWFFAATVQFFFQELLLVGFAIAMGMATLFFMLENPESMQDRRYGCFNSHALLLFLRRTYEKKLSYGVLDFNFMDSDGDINRQSVMDDAFDMVVQFLGRYPKLSVFKNVENEIVVFSKDMILLRKLIEEFKEEVVGLYDDENTSEDEFPSMNVLVIEDTAKLGSTDDLFSLMARTRVKLPTYRGLQIGYVDNEDINELFAYNEVKNELTNALLENRVEVFYQPIYSFKEEKYISCEALCRIRKKDGSLLSPGLFIPIAEETGLIVQLGETVFTKVCEFLSRKEISERLRYIEVNLSVAQFEERSLADRFIEIMEQYQIQPFQINLEITESTAIKGKMNLINNINKFLDQGISFSLDDFGKGESNLMYLVEMPVSIVKLDMDMTKAYFIEPKAKYVIDATVQMAHKLGLSVVSEGVETEEELNAMCSEKIDFIQGYYFSKPLPESEFVEELMKK